MTGRLLAYAASFRGFQPDARRFLLASVVVGAATSLWWIDFNLYLAALRLERSTIGIIATIASIASTLAALPASAISDRVGRRLVMLGSLVVGIAAIGGLILSASLLVVVLCASAWAAAGQAISVVQAPFLTEHSRPEHRSELFALQFAIGSLTNVVAAILGGLVAGSIAGAVGLDAGGIGVYQVILVIQALLLLGGLVVTLRIGDDRPARRVPRDLLTAGEPAHFGVRAAARGRPRGSSVALARLGLTVLDRGTFLRLLLPGFLIALGAGQVIPFLNIFVQHKFGLDLAALNAAFALMSLGTVVAILFQPALARRFGRLRSVVLVQGVSIPFLLVLGFSPILWTVVAAMAVRNSLMNAGNPIFTTFAMDQVTVTERATLSAAMSLFWSLGWALAGPWYAIVQGNLGFEAGYAVNFATIIVLYTVAAGLYWAWFRDAEAPPGQAPASAR